MLTLDEAITRAEAVMVELIRLEPFLTSPWDKTVKASREDQAKVVDFLKDRQHWVKKSRL